MFWFFSEPKAAAGGGEHAAAATEHAASAGHHTPPIVEFVTAHRDVYRYTHDQTVRLMNAGYTAP